MSDFQAFLMNIPWFAWIPIVAIVMSGIVKGMKMSHRHNERMAMIRAGMMPPEYKDR